MSRTMATPQNELAPFEVEAGAGGAQNAWCGVHEPCTSRNRATISPTVA